MNNNLQTTALCWVDSGSLLFEKFPVFPPENVFYCLSFLSLKTYQKLQINDVLLHTCKKVEVSDIFESANVWCFIALKSYKQLSVSVWDISLVQIQMHQNYKSPALLSLKTYNNWILQKEDELVLKVFLRSFGEMFPPWKSMACCALRPTGSEICRVSERMSGFWKLYWEVSWNHFYNESLW